MRKIAFRAMLAALVLFAFSALSVTMAQTTHDVHMLIQPVEGEPFPEFYFEPTGLFIEPGDTVRFIADTPHHTVTALHQQHGYPVTRVPDGVGPFSSPVVPVGETWEYTFEEPGVYDLVCVPHEIFGMAIRVVVGEATGPGAQPVPEEFVGQQSSATLLAAPSLSPDNIMESGTVSWSEIGSEHKILPPFLQNVEMPEGQQ